MKRFLFLLLFLLLTMPALTLAATGDDKFIAAREAYRVGEPLRLARMTQAMGDHELKPWAEYWLSSLAVSNGELSGAADFLAKYSGTYLADKLRGEWLKALGKNAAWPDVMAQYPLLQDPNQELTCLFWQARLALNDERGVLEDAYDLWLSGNEVPETCTPLINRLVATGRLDSAHVLARMRNLLEQARYAQAESAAALLPTRQMPDARALERIAANPARYLDHLPSAFINSAATREAAMFALVRLARKETDDAVTRWRRMEAKFSADDRGYMWGQLARRAAYLHMTEALAWYEQAGDTPLNADQQAWRVRAALRTMNWPAVQDAITRMSATLAAKPDWIYWRARAQIETGNREAAQVLYRSISGLSGFYGLLATEELGLPLSLPPRAAPPTSDELSKASNNVGLRQSLALIRLDMRVEAVREWNWTVHNMSDRELLAAAELARRNEVFDRAISTAERTLTEHDYSLRYLSPYRDAVSPKAQALALDDSWVYGLMRQESRFITSARSGVGARGLMQVMPNTAKLVARKIGLLSYRPGHADDMDTNVTLGTSYLKMVLQSLDNHPLLASAAYNAGPGRAKRWRGDHALEGAIYAETIPFDETRDYVKKVMANSVYYSALFEEKPQSLKSRLGIVQPANSADRLGGVDTDDAAP